MYNGIISALLQKRTNLARRRDMIMDQAKRQCEEIDREISDVDKAIETVEKAIKPYICKKCGGSGEESFTDAAGSRDTRPCRYCNGTGIIIAEEAM